VRIAIVDVGSNTTRLYIAELADGVITAEPVRLSRVTRLGAGVDASGRLADDALDREYAVLAEYRDVLQRDAKLSEAIAIMTSAVRDASNGPDFARTVKERFGIRAQILTGDEEARLTYLGATSDDLHSPTPEQGPTLVCDIGGGSTEFVIGHGGQLDFHVSTQAGVVRQADRHLTDDPPTAAELEAVATDVRATFEAAVPERWRKGIGRALGVAGTPTQLAAIAQSLVPYDPERVHGYMLTREAIDEIFRRLRTMTLAERKQVPGIHPDRANVTLPGIGILQEVMRLFNLDAIEVSEHDILRGAALAYAAADRPPGG
jgi:exopolyphosphatase/guanosine-5'-triphosphate,3'-diphosphate pyrophosphatase